jgi:aryl-alcohol dehydrogenase-like predicted oxidoreductase
MMEYRLLGRTELKISTICLGTMQFGWTSDASTSHSILDEAFELGCNFIDTADIYSSWAPGNKGGESEAIIGNWIAKGDRKREDIIIATKVRGKMGESPNNQGLSRRHILASVRESLRRLRTDYIDLYQVHWPDKDTPLEETLEAMDQLIRTGLVRYIGCSNYPAWLLMKSLWVSDTRRLGRFDSLQPHYNYIHRAEFERELEEVCLDQKIGVIPYSPLAGGFLTGKYRRDSQMPDSARAEGIKRRYYSDSGFAALDKLIEMAGKYEVSAGQMAIAWILANPSVTSAIIGANSIEQLEETIFSAQVELSDEHKRELDRVTAWT